MKKVSLFSTTTNTTGVEYSFSFSTHSRELIMRLMCNCLTYALLIYPMVNAITYIYREPRVKVCLGLGGVAPRFHLRLEKKEAKIILSVAFTRLVLPTY